MELIGRRAWSRFITLVKPFFQSEVRWHALSLLALLVTLLLSVSGFNVLNSYVGRDFMTALADREPHLFSRLALLYIGVFVLLTVVAVFARFVEERLGVLWCEWLTRRCIDRYLANRAYFRMQTARRHRQSGPRITEDVRSFTSTTLSFLLIFFNSTLALISFAGILWSITPWLVLAAVAYAAGGSLVAVLLGRKLVNLNIQEQAQGSQPALRVHSRPRARRVRGPAGRRDEGTQAAARPADGGAGERQDDHRGQP